MAKKSSSILGGFDDFLGGALLGVLGGALVGAAIEEEEERAEARRVRRSLPLPLPLPTYVPYTRPDSAWGRSTTDVESTDVKWVGGSQIVVDTICTTDFDRVGRVIDKRRRQEPHKVYCCCRYCRALKGI